ncbi:bifunctional 4-hydroxy-2-oxoglutarate aldolase/2-dehydro-3-deoxy-phosphogluconate aldolase [Pseudoflavonifractor sp. BIOML-A6]|jgi:2-dehydro-3-deoxyphosphogluconate aldolase/4-hydroxy-2-oxoglutarate aldolase|nr:MULTISPECIES: bifunctional 2-keto-4-hydroxyglutarate aldolase/2-keto-3-deoxy-6-phosphogluconate aldolase [unclassified Pseudoflavonifractor]MTQ96874.1 bifunctional 4-hydroxy-2-oxoglutarate aldolase/2-dehydro-3-deoxy-phosphogluconate aldolase [Pseudoflavonifractor sp. BIOML-A16]MTR05033.1 bifunctional 4-hydroxy-2-oxoglutarate aldolase/2-dehydro-3-deoxy-phosphogluconate aldolase [Pseudoflavonifractor sp. BIOML-A15]MTR32654.1 bifunctional 4-hydroxy-2-oxoglutarate aldolase/2-dehydro-3-deoxy-phosp
MEKAEVLRAMEDCGVVAVIRGRDAQEVRRAIDACVAGGVTAIEVTFTVPGATDIIRELIGHYDSRKVLVGAGTVLDPETARAAILSGAQFVVAPSLNRETLRLCLRYQVACIPGAMTIKEVIDCMEAGADIVKIFPANLFGPKIIKNIRGPLPQARLMPTGGVTAENAGDWIRAGAVAVGAGSDLTAGAKTGDFDTVTRTARQMVASVRSARA